MSPVTMGVSGDVIPAIKIPKTVVVRLFVAFRGFSGSITGHFVN